MLAMARVRPQASGMDTMPLAPIGGRAAWRGEDLSRSRFWPYRLAAAEIAALDQALAAVKARGLAPPGFGAEAFPIPGLAPLLAAMLEELDAGTGVVRLSGLPVERYDMADLKRIFWGLSVNLGIPLYQTRGGEVLAEVKDESGTGRAIMGVDPVTGGVAQSRARSRSTGPLRFHTDRCDLLSLLCASNGIEGGVSKVVSTVAINDEIGRRRPDLLEVLHQDFWRMRPPEEQAGPDGRMFRMPVFGRGPDGAFTSNYSRTYVELAHAEPGMPPLEGKQLEALDLLAQVAEELCVQAPFTPGDIQFLNQHVTYHGRTAYADDAKAGAQRVLLRIWVCPPRSRALPANHAVQWGDTRPGALRGGAVVGRSAIAA